MNLDWNRLPEELNWKKRPDITSQTAKRKRKAEEDGMKKLEKLARKESDQQKV